MMNDFKNQKCLHKRYAFQIVLQTREMLRALPSLVDINIPDGKHFTVCGDVHGQFYDLLNIFELNGLPSEENPYLFNGDFVDRGSFSVEYTYPFLKLSAIYLSRGNHESKSMNKIYGFEGEVRSKLSETFVELFAEVFCCLPLAHVINDKVFVVHGGLMCELLWSDPQPYPGRGPSKRGVGLSFGVDVTEKFLLENNLDLVVRSHEVKDEGYEIEHDGKLITVFSAPNYCDQMGNKGAFMQFEAPELKPNIVTFSAVVRHRRFRVSLSQISGFHGLGIRIVVLLIPLSFFCSDFRVAVMETGVNSSGPADGSVSLMDQNATNPGPIDASVLYDQENHVSSAVWDGQERGVLRCHEHTSKLGEWRLTQRQIELVEKAGFGYLRRFPSISLDNPLISALVERWRKETNTFHLRVGEMTITLEDVALLLGLAIDGEPVLGVTYTSCKSVCEKFLGRVPDTGYMSGGMVKLSWLKEYFSQCPDDSPLEEIERHTRAYLLYLVGSTIFSTTTGNKVPIMYLPLFDDFEKAGKYAWGAAALAFLYRALGRASLKSQSTISGCLTLLQVEWVPYNNLDSNLIPKSVRSILILGRSKTMLICFDKAERHLPDRCLRQIGILQGIPKDVDHWERKSRGVDSGIDLSGKMESELSEWSARKLHIVQDDGGGVDEREYMHWYSRITRKFVGRPVSPLPQFQRTVKFRTKKKRMNAGLRDIAHLADTFLTEGLDPMQIDSITRIRSIAHDCLGDHIADETVISVNSQIGDLVEDTTVVATTSQKEDLDEMQP
ncbi:hypothetical protein GH714_033696 [Hevea brasiliensis]|uniref:protein-serine/threonine phosphatase n=1 Tax=Hevea brasiliensis TaxID=3981 RepID=A0A6A6LL64_HEVBR|nr:hypothetical protein GH714_033696 [Hevea brasiliensis]